MAVLHGAEEEIWCVSLRVPPIPHILTQSNRPIYVGDLVFVPVVAQKILLLNSYEVATELLSKRGLRYSERFLFPLMDEA